MKNHILVAHSRLKDGCDRASSLVAVFDHLRRTAPAALNCDDILRSALVLSVSSFDLFIHDLFRLEIVYRFSVNRKVPSLRIPFDILVSTEELQAAMIDECIRKDHSYKSFVAPSKLAECLSLLIENPWEKIGATINERHNILKEKLRNIVDLRNRIAHEADVNPAYGGVELWPIYMEDVEASISTLQALGSAIANIVDGS